MANVKSNRSEARADADFHGKLSNINLGGDVGISHIAMDKSPKIKAEIERTILAVPQTR